MSARAAAAVVVLTVASFLGFVLFAVVSAMDLGEQVKARNERILGFTPDESSTTSTSAPSIVPPAPPSSVVTTSTTAPSTTTTRPSPTFHASSSGNPVPSAADGAELRTTAYCLRGRMASGRPTYVGAVAANRYALGTRLTVWPNPWGDPGMIFTVEDRHKPGATELDFAMPGECHRALEWGNRRYATVRTVGG